MIDNQNELIKHFEGCSLSSYKCPAGKWTIGYGHTGSDVYQGLTITQREAEDLLTSDLIKFEGIIQSLVRVPLNKNQKAALVSFVFNVGDRAFKRSTLLRLLNLGEYRAAASEFRKWDKVDREPNHGLAVRRVAETELFKTETKLA